MDQPDDVLPLTSYDEYLSRWYQTKDNVEFGDEWLDKQYYESRITQQVLAAYWEQVYDNPNMVIQDWYDKIYKPAQPVPEIPPPRERTTFIKALEDAFWEAGGPRVLQQLAQDNPLEFLKICARLIPADMSVKNPNGGLAITFNIATPTNETPIIEVTPDD